MRGNTKDLEERAALSMAACAALSQSLSFIDKDTEVQGDDVVFLDASQLLGRRAVLQIPAA